MQKLFQHFETYGKDRSWNEIGELYGILPNGSSAQRADKVRKLFNRSYTQYRQQAQPQVERNKMTDLLEEFKEFLNQRKGTKIYTPHIGGDPNNILIIGDTHVPYHLPEYLDFCQHLQAKWNCGKVIHIGDLVDFASTTFHSGMPALSVDYELAVTKIELAKWNQAFPQVTCLMGNHDRRVARKMFDANIGSHWQKSFNDVFEISWEFLPDYEYNGIYFCHGEGATARVTSLQKQMPAVQGHRHSETYIDWPARNLFAMQCPLGADRRQLAFDYCKVDPKDWTLGAAVIIDNKTPIIERL